MLPLLNSYTCHTHNIVASHWLGLLAIAAIESYARLLLQAIRLATHTAEAVIASWWPHIAADAAASHWYAFAAPQRYNGQLSRWLIRLLAIDTYSHTYYADTIDTLPLRWYSHTASWLPYTQYGTSLPHTHWYYRIIVTSFSSAGIHSYDAKLFLGQPKVGWLLLRPHTTTGHWPLLSLH